MGRELVYQRYRERTLWRISAFERGPARRLRLAVTGIENPSISRDGHSVVFSVGRSDLDIARSPISASVSEPVSERVISSTRLDTESELSPDGRRIVFASERSGTQEIWIAALDGSGSRQLTDLRNAVNGSPSWSPDGKWIAFDSRRDGGNGRMFIVQADQSGVRQVTNGAADDSHPRWSRDGRWLYFNSNRSGQARVWKASTSDFSDQHQVTTRGGNGPVESPDGRYLYYVQRSGTPGPQRLWRLRTSTGEEESLLPSRNINYWDFAAGNDGVYFTDTPETNAGRSLYFYDLATGQVRRAASLPKSYFCCLEISSDGRYAYYTVLNDQAHDLMIVQNFR